MLGGKTSAGGLRYAGLGASIGVPSSKLENVTSMDPKDYTYCIPSIKQHTEAWQGLQEDRDMEDMMHCCSRSNGYGIDCYPFQVYGQTQAVLDTDPGLHGILSLDLDAECVKLVMGSALTAVGDSVRGIKSAAKNVKQNERRMTTRAASRKIPICNENNRINNEPSKSKDGDGMSSFSAVYNDVASIKDGNSMNDCDTPEDDGELLHAPATIAQGVLDIELISSMPIKTYQSFGTQKNSLRNKVSSSADSALTNDAKLELKSSGSIIVREQKEGTSTDTSEIKDNGTTETSALKRTKVAGSHALKPKELEADKHNLEDSNRSDPVDRLTLSLDYNAAAASINAVFLERQSVHTEHEKNAGEIGATTSDFVDSTSCSVPEIIADKKSSDYHVHVDDSDSDHSIYKEIHDGKVCTGRRSSQRKRRRGGWCI